MGSVGAPEILVILVVALLVLGPDRLPEAARQAGRVLAEVKRMSSGFQAELRDAMQTPVAGPPAPPTSASSSSASADSPSGNGVATPAGAERRVSWADLPATDERSS